MEIIEQKLIEAIFAKGINVNKNEQKLLHGDS